MTARNASLDAARAIAMMCVVGTHAAVSFMVTPVGWAIQDRSRNLGVDLWAWIVRAFAMPTFFWLAGYFSRAVLVHGGLAAFAKNRATRIFVPLAVALVPCSLVVGALWDWGREVGARAAVADNIPKLQKSEFSIFLGHLWFLYYLLALSIAAVVVAAIVRRVPARLPVLAVPAAMTFGALAYLHALQPNTPLGFVPDVPILTYMGGFFAWGWLAHARPAELARYARRMWLAAAIALGALAIVIVTLARGLTAIDAPPRYASAASAAFSIAVMIAFLGACQRYLATPRPLLRFASDASYWFYIVHLPVVVALQILLARVAIPGPIKYVAIVAVTTVVCLGVYALGRRRNSLTHRYSSR
ncbi:MAG TPA: acyltransferase [Kofleriaceae bacterium]|jgi:peptidoglycan/LPS O-acetylase OafA/YrhL